MMIRRGATMIGLLASVTVAIAGYQLLQKGQEEGLAESQGIGDADESADVVLTPEEVFPTAAELAEIVVTSDNAPEGWVIEETLLGRVALDYLIRYGQVRDATTGFIDARATNFCAAGEGCGTSWIAVYRSEADAEDAVSVFRGEMQVGWGMGSHAEPLGFGQDQGFAFMNNLGNAAANHAYLWRTDNVLLGMLAGGEIEVATLRLLAEEMNARSP